MCDPSGSICCHGGLGDDRFPLIGDGAAWSDDPVFLRHARLA